MKRLYILITLFLVCCSTVQETEIRRTPELQADINRTLTEDRRNKELELEYLNEIRMAQENNDTDALDFYLTEYLNVPRLKIPDWMKDEPNYFEGGDRVKY